MKVLVLLHRRTGPDANRALAALSGIRCWGMGTRTGWAPPMALSPFDEWHFWRVWLGEHHTVELK